VMMVKKQGIIVGLLILGAYFLVSAGGWLIFQLETGQELPPGWELIRPPGEIYAMIEDGDYIYTGGLSGVFKIDRRSRLLLEQLGLPGDVDHVKALHMDEENNLWIGHFNGLTILTKNGPLSLGPGEALPDKRVNCIYQDSSGRLLIGTWGGVALYDGIGWQSITTGDGLLVDMVNVIMEDSRGGFWFGHYLAPRGGISYLREGKWQYFTVEEGLPHNNITSLLEDKAGYVWAGTGLFQRGGAARFVLVGDEWEIAEVLTEADGLAGEKVRFIFQDRRGVYWFTSEFDGVAVFTEGELFGGRESLVLTEETGLANYEVKVILEDVDGTIWLGTHNGLNSLSREALRVIP
jgi:ligand-binding sensor domain-containing protein